MAFSGDISVEIETLVDSLSALIVAVASDNLQDIRPNGLALSAATSKVARLVQESAVASKDAEFQEEATKVMGEIAGTVSQLVASIGKIVSAPGDATYKRSFGNACEKMGEAVNKLMLLSDSSASKNIIKYIQLSVASNKRLAEEAVDPDPKAFSPAYSKVRAHNEALAQAINTAIIATVDFKKRRLLIEGLNDINAGVPVFMENCRRLSNTIGAENLSRAVTSDVHFLSLAYQKLITASQINPYSYIQKVHDTMEQMQSLMDLADEMQRTARLLYNLASSGRSGDDYVDSAKRLASNALNLVRQAQVAADSIQDPLRKYAIQRAASRIRQLGPELIKAAQDYQANQTPQYRDILDTKHRDLQTAISDLKSATLDSDPESRLAMGAKYILLSAGDVREAAERRDPSLGSSAKILTSLVNQFNDDAKGTRRADTGKEAVQHLASFIRSAQAASSPSRSSQDVDNLNENYHKFVDVFSNRPAPSRVDAAAISRSRSSTDVSIPRSIPDTTPAPASIAVDSELLRAAAEQADLAAKLADLAEKKAQTIADPRKKQEALEVVAKIRQQCAQVRDLAYILAHHPDDAAASQALANAQKALADSVHRLISLAAPDTAEMRSAAGEVKNAAQQDDVSDILKSAQSLVDVISGTLAAGKEALDPSRRQGINNGANELARMLRQMAASSTDKAFADQLIEFAKIICDRALQVKILMSVAQSAGNLTSNVTSALQGLKTTLNELVNYLCASALKKSLAATILQVDAIKRVLSVWQAL